MYKTSEHCTLENFYAIYNNYFHHCFYLNKKLSCYYIDCFCMIYILKTPTRIDLQKKEYYI